MMELNCQQLHVMGKDIPTPFLLQVNTDRGEESIRVSKILRNIPGERITAIAIWKESEIIIKLLLRGTRNKRLLFNELRAADLLRQRQIPTPDILHHSNTTDSRGTVLFIDLLQDAQNLEEMFQRSRTDAERDDVMKLAMQALSRCHQAGIWQDGFNLSQLMLANGRVYVLSSGILQTQNEPLAQQQRRSLLAEFLSKLPVACDENLPELCEFYQGTSFNQEPLDPATLQNDISQQRSQHINMLAKGSFRKQEKVFQVEQSNYLLVYQASFPRKIVEQFEQDPNALLAQGKMIKDGSSTTVVSLRLEDKHYVLKRYNKKSFGHGITRLFRPSRASNCWRMARVFRALGIDTPDPILFMEKRLLWSMRGDSYLLTEKIDADHLLNQMESNPALRLAGESLLEKFKALFKVMKEYRVSHGDMKATNFLLSGENLIAIDLDAAKRHSSDSRYAKALAKDWHRFMRNWEGTGLAGKFAVIHDELKLGVSE